MTGRAAGFGARFATRAEAGLREGDDRASGYPLSSSRAMTSRWTCEVPS